MPEPLARIRVSPLRRVLGLGVLLSLGGVLLWLGLARPPAALGWQAFLLLLGGGVLWAARPFGRATGLGLELTEEALRDTTGRELARLDSVRGVDRGMLAFKPSNGFVLTLDTAPGRAWAPGLWWRMGRRVGVGGVTAAAETRLVADLIAARLAERGER